jgi:hypothetical protein
LFPVAAEVVQRGCAKLKKPFIEPEAIAEEAEKCRKKLGMLHHRHRHHYQQGLADLLHRRCVVFVCQK